MTRSNSLFVSLVLIGATTALSLPGLADPPTRAILPPVPRVPSQTKKTTLVKEMDRLPLSF